MAVLASDAFTNTDGTVLTSHSANWSIQFGADQLKILSNAVGVTATGNVRGNRYSGITWPDDQYSQAAVVAVADWLQGVTVRAQSDGNLSLYFAGQDNNDLGHKRYTIIKFVNAVPSVISTHGSQLVTAGDVIRLTITGTNLSLKVNDVEILTGSDATLSAGQAGLVAFHDNTTTALMDTWEGGDTATLGLMGAILL